MSKNTESKEQLIHAANKPATEANYLHSFYRGKLEVVPKCRIKDFTDFAIWYTPGVAAVCREIVTQPDKVFEFTNKSNFVAVISDGTRVLGLGDIGPAAALPVMEGKSILFKYLGGVDAFPLCLNTKDTVEFIRTCKILTPTFGGINLEDIEKPKCYTILDTLRAETDIPVWHDDRQGTAAITLAGLINALKVVGKNKESVRISMIGAGAANIAIAKLMFKYGFPPENIVMVDSQGILHRNRSDILSSENKDTEKKDICKITNQTQRTGGIPEAIRDTDVCISLARPGPDLIKKEWIATMRKHAIVFVCANPIPEIWPWEAKEAGACIVATGRSDFPNQLNNSIGFPGIFRGALDVAAKTITDEMCLAASIELAAFAEEKGLSPEYIIPRMDEWELFPREAVAVGMKAISQGIARKILSRDDLTTTVREKIVRSREQLRVLMDSGVILSP